MLGTNENKNEMYHLEVLKPPSSYIVVNTVNEIRLCLKKGNRVRDTATRFPVRLDCSYESDGEVYSSLHVEGSPAFDEFGICVVKFTFHQIAKVVDKRIQKISCIVSVFDDAQQLLASTATFPVVCVEYYLDVQISSLSAPFIFYKDKGGKDAGIDLTVYLKRGDDVVKDMPIKIRPALQYENGTMVQDQGILKSINDLENFNIKEGVTRLKFRINQVSSKHLNQKFCIVMMKNAPADVISNVAPGRSDPIDVRSKTNRKREEEEEDDSGGYGHSSKRKKDDPPSLPFTADSLALISGEMAKDFDHAIQKLQYFNIEMNSMLEGIRWRQNTPQPYPNDVIDGFLSKWSGHFEHSVKILRWVHGTITKNDQARANYGRMLQPNSTFGADFFGRSPMPIFSQETAAPVAKWDSKIGGMTSAEPYNWPSGNNSFHGRQQPLMTAPYETSAAQAPVPTSSGITMLAEAAKVAEHHDNPQALTIANRPTFTAPVTHVSTFQIDTERPNTSLKWADVNVTFVVKGRVRVEGDDFGFPAFIKTSQGRFQLCGFYQLRTDAAASSFDRDQAFFSSFVKNKTKVKYDDQATLESQFRPQLDVFAVEYAANEDSLSYIFMQPQSSAISPYLRRLVFTLLDQIPAVYGIRGNVEALLSPSMQVLSDLISLQTGGTRHDVSEALLSGAGRVFKFNAAGEMLLV